MVPTERLELSRVAPPPPQDGVSTNFTTSAVLTRKIIALRKTEFYYSSLTYGSRQQESFLGWPCQPLELPGRQARELREQAPRLPKNQQARFQAAQQRRNPLELHP